MYYIYYLMFRACYFHSITHVHYCFFSIIVVLFGYCLHRNCTDLYKIWKKTPAWAIFSSGKRHVTTSPGLLYTCDHSRVVLMHPDSLSHKDMVLVQYCGTLFPSLSWADGQRSPSAGAEIIPRHLRRLPAPGTRTGLLHDSFSSNVSMRSWQWSCIFRCLLAVIDPQLSAVSQCDIVGNQGV